MLRDLEDLILRSLIAVFSDATGIPSGHFWVDYPSENFFNESTYSKFPSVGIIETSLIPKNNNYGDTFTTPISSGMVTTYSPAGELDIDLQLQVYTERQSDRRLYRTLINQWLQQNTSIKIINDVIPDQYFSIWCTKSVITHEIPYVSNFFLKIIGQDFQEQTSYAIENAFINLHADFEIDVNSPSGFVRVVDITSGGVTFG